MHRLTISGQTIPYTLRTSRRALRLQLRMTVEEGLVVVVPANSDQALVGPFLDSKSRWILKHRERFERLRAQRGPQRIEDGVQVLFRGVAHTVRVRAKERSGGSGGVTQREGELVISLPSPEHVATGRALESWMRGQAREAVLEEIAGSDEPGQFPFQRVCIRDQKTRWGSCSRRGTLSFNWRLIMAPPHVLRYVVAHELAHIREPNHSVRFWRLLRALHGDYEEPRRWLREHGGRLR